ncbi:MAG: VOC family protein [Bacillota bacterium]|nr:VOC family protein [Bacillota bacterium]
MSTPETALVREINHAGLRVADMETSLVFYRDLLDGRVIRDARPLTGPGRFVYVQLANSVVELVESRADDPQLGWQHIAFLTTRARPIATIVDDVREAGHSITAPARRSGTGHGSLAFFRDASGMVWELLEREEDIRIPALDNRVIDAVAEFRIEVAPAAAPVLARLLGETLGLPAAGPGLWQLGPDRIAVRTVATAPERPFAGLVLNLKSPDSLPPVLREQVRDGLLHGPDGECLRLEASHNK